MTSVQPAELTREVEGRTVPAPGRWYVDRAHSTVGFVARHLMVAKTRGRFTDYDVDLTIGDRPEESRLSVSIRAPSITTDNPDRDAHLRSADFLDVESHPTLEYRSTSVTPGAGGRWHVDGDLTIRGETRPVPLDVEFAGIAADPFGNDKAFFSAAAEIDREDFGLVWNQPLANGGVLVGKKVRIELEIEAQPTDPAAA